MSVKATTAEKIILNTMQIGVHKLRYINVCQTMIDEINITEFADVNKKPPNSNNRTIVILFFSADVLNICQMPVKKRSSFHLKVALKRHCVKLQFPQQLGNVTGSTTDAWFYDIHGLFKVCFDFYKHSDQVTIMKHLFTVWNKSENLFLPGFMKLKREDINLEETILTVLSHSTAASNCSLCDDIKGKKYKSAVHNVIQNSKGTQSADVSTSEYAVQCDLLLFGPLKIVPVVDKSISKITVLKRKRDHVNTAISYQQYLKTKKIKFDHCDNLSRDIIKHTVEVSSSILPKTNVKEKCNQKNMNLGKVNVSADELTHTFVTGYSPQRPESCCFINNNDGKSLKTFFDELSTIISKYEAAIATDSQKSNYVIHLLGSFIYLLRKEQLLSEPSACGSYETSTVIFPFHVILDIVEFHKRLKTNQSNVGPDDLYKNLVFKMFSKWFGNVCKETKKQINENLDQYKYLNLMNNQGIIPIPKDVILHANLFPPFMISFVEMWIQNEEAVTASNENFLYSRILLVLEILNDSLITGVGHVVYAKLKSHV